jgi:hypothetical protein
MNQLQKLNELAKSAGYDQLNNKAYIIEPWGDRTSTTILFDKGDVAMLNPVQAVPIKDYFGEKSKVPEDYRGVVAIHRAAISYGVVSRMNSLADLKTTLSPIINAGIVDLSNQIGFMHGFKITMEMPDGNYFREFENSNGYEFRITVIKE